MHTGQLNDENFSSKMCHQNASDLLLECQSTPGLEVNWSVIVIYFHSTVHSMLEHHLIT